MKMKKPSLNPLDYTEPVTLDGVEVTPEIAQLLLAFNTCNRPKNWNKIGVYASDMKHGRWIRNGTSLGFTKNNGKSDAGRLQDGQKRLLACIQAKKPFVTNITFGLEPEAFDTHDAGEPRRMAHVLDVMGRKNTACLASALKMVNDYYDGTMLTRRPYANNEAKLLLKRYSGIEDSINVGRGLKKVTIPSVAVAMHYLFNKVDPVAAGIMFEQLKSGAGLELSSPVHTLRETLHASAKAGEKKLKPYAVAALFVKTFNAIQERKKMKKLAWIGSGEKAEMFPEILNLPPRKRIQVMPQPLDKAA
jgi:hypothetical protein